MTREFKFRAWDGEKMHYNVVPWQWDFVIDTTFHKCIESIGTGLFGSGGKTAKMEVPAIRFKELMQFTGLKDKNGKEIYEGDSVVINEFTNEGMSKLNFDDDLDVFSLEELKGDLEIKFDSQVKFEDGEFFVQVPNNGTIFPLAIFFGNQKKSQPISEIEVIGNIYE